MKNKFDKINSPSGVKSDDSVEHLWKSAELTKSRLKFNGKDIEKTSSPNPKGGSRFSGSLSGTAESSAVKKKEDISNDAFHAADSLSLDSSPTLRPSTSRIVGTAKKSLEEKNVSSNKYVNIKKAPAKTGAVAVSKTSVNVSASKPNAAGISTSEKKAVTVLPTTPKASATKATVSKPVAPKTTMQKIAAVKPAKTTATVTPTASVKNNAVKKDVIKANKLSSSSISQYEKFCEKRTCLAKIIDDTSKAVAQLNMKAFTEKLHVVSNKISGDTFKIQIVGNFKNGKSTFINSFLGQDVLPAYARPCTAVINEVKYGDDKKAVLHFKHPLPDVLPKELSTEAMAHIKKYASKKIPPMIIPYDKIEDYVVIPMGKDPKDMLLESPYEKVELYWPLELLKNGVEIIDSPGLNEHATRTKVTMDYINKTDAIIFVLNATSLCSMDEMAFIRNNLKAQGFEDLFFVINRFDLIPEKERARMKKFAIKQLGEFTSFGEKGLFFTSAKEALDAKKSDDLAKLENSGLLGFEKALSEYLTQNRGQLKLSTPAKNLSRILNGEVLEKIIPRQRELLDVKVGDLQQRYKVIKPKLTRLENKKRRLYDNMIADIKKCRSEFKLMASQNSVSVLNSIPEWVMAFEPKTKLGLIPNQNKVQEMSAEISSHISLMLEKNSAEWQKNMLIPVIKKRAAEIFGESEKETRSIMEEIRAVSNIATGDSENSNGNVKDFNYDFSSAFNFSDSKEIANALALKTAGNSLLVMLSFTAPTDLVGILSYLFAGSGSSPVHKIKEAVIKETSLNLQNNSKQFETTVSEGVVQAYTEIANKIVSPLDEEISEIQGQIEAAISNIEKGEDVINRKKKTLNSSETKIKTLCSLLDEFINELAAI